MKVKSDAARYSKKLKAWKRNLSLKPKVNELLKKVLISLDSLSTSLETDSTRHKMSLLYQLYKPVLSLLSLKKTDLSTNKSLFLKQFLFDIKTDLMEIDHDAYMALQYDNNQKKLNTEKHNTLKKLESYYKVERESYKYSEKKKSWSTALKADDLKYNLERYDTKKNRAKLTLKQLDLLETLIANVDNGKNQNYRFSPEEFFVAGLVLSENTNIEVVYLNKIERTVHAIKVRDSKLSTYKKKWLSCDAVSLKQGVFRAFPIVYAMGQRGTLYASPEGSSPNNGYRESYFNHSSFLAGRSVICAGELIVRNGELLGISNASGHYKPHPDHLYHCLIELRDQGLSLNQTLVQILCFLDDEEALLTYKANDFIEIMQTLAERNGHTITTANIKQEMEEEELATFTEQEFSDLLVSDMWNPERMWASEPSSRRKSLMNAPQVSVSIARSRITLVKQD